MKLLVRFLEKKPSDNEIADALESIAHSVAEGYTRGIGMPRGVLSWDINKKGA